MIGNVRNKKSPSLVGVQSSKVMVFSSMSCMQINSSHCQTAWHELVKGCIHMENTIKRISAVQSSLHLLGTPKAKCTERRWRHWRAIGLVRVFLFRRSSLECTTCLACAGTCMLLWGELRRWFLITIHHHAPVQINIFFACFFVHSLQRHAHEGQTRANVSLAILLGKTTYSTAWQLHHQHSPAVGKQHSNPGKVHWLSIVRLEDTNCG